MIKMNLVGKTCLITGANSGLGKAIAVDMARKGASVIMACRRHYTDAQTEVKKRSGSNDISIRTLNLSSLKSVHRFCDYLRDDGCRVDIAFFNAGIALANNAISTDGFSLLWQINYLSNALLAIRMLQDNVIPNAVFSRKRKRASGIPRIIFTSSSRHRENFNINFEHFGKFEDFHLRDALKWYGLSKLYLMTFAWELGQRLMIKDKPEVSVHSFCPGPFRSRIGNEMGMIARLVTSTLPISAERAAWPAIHLATAPNMEGTTLKYMHKREFEKPDDRITDSMIGGKLWTETMKLIESNCK